MKKKQKINESNAKKGQFILPVFESVNILDEMIVPN